MAQLTIPALVVTLVERLQSRENLELEFKAAKGGIPKSIWPTVSAFANTGGGWIVLGIGQKDDGSFAVEGVTDAAKLLDDFYSQIRSPEKISYPVCGADDAATDVLNGREILILRIHASPRKDRPVYINGNPYLGTYLRRHTGDYRCTKREVDRMMREASDAAADSTVLPYLTWDDLDRDALMRYRQRHQTHEPGSPRNGYSDQRFLQAIGGYRSDPEAGRAGITVAGLLMFGTPEALRNWRGRHLIDYRHLPAERSLDSRWDDRIVWEGHLFGAFESIYPKLVAGQPTPFKLQGATRIDDTPIHIALREALINLLVHADYAEPQVSLIQRASEACSFRNPGNSRVSIGELLTGDRSDPRNPELVRMFRYIGLADEGGTGMPKILRAWRELGFQLPAIDIGTERYEFEIRLRHAHLIAAEDRDWLQSLGEGWTEAEQLALVLARHDGDIDNTRLRSVTGLHAADATKILGNLRGRGLLEMSGSGRYARYTLTAAALTAAIQLAADSGGTTSPSQTEPTKHGSRTRMALADRVLRQLRRAGEGGMTLRDLTRALRDRTAPEIRAIVERLVDTAVITTIKPSNSRGSLRYKLAQQRKPGGR